MRGITLFHFELIGDMGEHKNHHFYDFEPQNQLFLSLETPGHLNKSSKIPGTFLKYIIFVNIMFRSSNILTISEEMGTDKLLRSV